MKPLPSKLPCLAVAALLAACLPAAAQTKLRAPVIKAPAKVAAKPSAPSGAAKSPASALPPRTESAAAAQTVAWDQKQLASFMKELADGVLKRHMRRDGSLLRGMVYQYAMPATSQQGYGRDWDGMRQGACFGNACLLAYRATRDKYYLEVARQWLMPFALRLIAGSERLFANRDGAFLDGQTLPPERATAQRGFLPLFCDDGTGVCFDALAERKTVDEALPVSWTVTNLLRDRSARDGKVAGYAHGTTTSMTASWSLMLANLWLVTRDPQLALATRILKESLAKQAGSEAPLLALADAVTHGDRARTQELAAALDQSPWPPATPLYRALVTKERVELPTHLDAELLDYLGVALAGHVGAGTTRRLTETASDSIALEDRWFGKRTRPKGLSLAENSPVKVTLEKGKFSAPPDGRGVLVGSRLGTQRLWVCAQSLQLLAAFPEAWAKPSQGPHGEKLPGWTQPSLSAVRARLKAEVEGGLTFWQSQLKSIGYLRPDWPLSLRKPDPAYWTDQTSEAGAYANLLAACSAYLVYLDGRRDWELAATVWLGQQ